MFSSFCWTCTLTNGPMNLFHLKPELHYQTTCVNDKQPKCPHFEKNTFLLKVWKCKIILTRIGKDEHARTGNLSIPSRSTFLCPVSVMDGESVAHSCIQLTNCPSPIMALPLCDLWKIGRDGMNRQLRLKKGTEDRDKLKRWIWRKLYIWGLAGHRGVDELLLCLSVHMSEWG